MEKIKPNKMKNIYVSLVLILFVLVFANNHSVAQARHTCSTFQISTNDTIIVAHNLDDYVTFPGMVVVNPRGIEKESLSWEDFRKGKKKDSLRLKWTSKFGSITYTIFGRDLIDGGMNEAGLYIGEMTLMQTLYPVDETKPTFHTNFWMQYILDCFSTVDEAIESLSTFNIDGTCRWHFFLADKLGNTAIVEFIDGKVCIYKGENMPHKILCNTTYKSDLDSLALYSGYGGSRVIDIQDKENTKRTVRASELIRLYSENPQKPIIDYSFDMLRLLDLGNNLWQIVCDLSNGRIYFNTHLNRNIKYIDLNAFDFSNKSSKYIDIHIDESNDVANLFIPLTPKINKKYVRKTWWAIDMGFWGNILVKPFAVWGLGARMNGYTGEFYAEN